MWYVLQTMTGKEKELVRMVGRIIPPELYEDCFVAYYERIWRRQQQSIVHVERLFPGYVMIITDYPQELFLRLKYVPALSKLLSDGYFDFIPLKAGEEAFLSELLPEDRIVRLSYVETDGKGHVHHVSGPLEHYTDRIIRYQFKKRYVIIHFQLLGLDKTAALGIILREDVQQELAYGKVEAPVTLPKHYKVDLPEVKAPYEPGDHVRVTAGTFTDMEGIIWRVKKNTVEIGIHLFGQDISMEVSMDEICGVDVLEENDGNTE